MTTVLAISIGVALLYAGINKKDGLFILVCWLALYILVPHNFLYELEYSIYYGPNMGDDFMTSPISNSVKMAPYPIDCDLLTSPIGNKGCYYEPVVTEVIQKSRSQRDGKWYPIVTYDQGRTWQWDDPAHPTMPLINVIWQRKEGTEPAHWTPLLTVIGGVAALSIIGTLGWYEQTVPTPPPAGQQSSIWWRLLNRSPKPPRPPRPPRPQGAEFWEHVRWLLVWDQPISQSSAIKRRLLWIGSLMEPFLFGALYGIYFTICRRLKLDPPLEFALLFPVPLIFLCIISVVSVIWKRYRGQSPMAEAWTHLKWIFRKSF